MEDIDRVYKSVCRIKSHSFDIKLTYADDDNYYLHKPVIDLDGTLLTRLWMYQMPTTRDPNQIT
jgi:hypothetical protein